MTYQKLMFDCVENDPVDVKAGGPAYLGFDFVIEVPDGPRHKAISFIADELQWIMGQFKRHGVPTIKLVSYDFEETPLRVWTRPEIEAEIQRSVDSGLLNP